MGFARRGQPWRRFLDVGYSFTNDDMVEWTDRFAALYPHAVYFDARAMRFVATHRTQRDDVWFHDGDMRRHRAEGRQTDVAPAMFSNWRTCAANVPSLPYSHSVMTKGVIIRAPWPEEISRGRAADLCGSRRAPGYIDDVGRDPRYWRALGRYVGIDWCESFPDFVPAAAGRKAFHGTEKDIDIKEFEHCVMPQPMFSTTEFRSMYLHADPEFKEFISSVRSLSRGMMTRQAAMYEAKSRKYLGPYPNSEKRGFSKRLFKSLAMMPDAYDHISKFRFLLEYSTDPELIEMRKANVPDRMVGIGPTPELKALAYLEDGRSIDGIDGLDETTRVRLLRRFEKLHSDRGKRAG